MLTYDTPALGQTGGRNLMVPKMFPTIYGTYMKLVTKYQISAINSCWEKCDEKCAYMLNVYKNQQSRQTGSRNLTGPKTLPTIWSLWPNIRSLPSIVAEKNVTKNEHICSMWIKINKVGKQEVGIWWVQNSYWEKCDEKYLGRREGRKDGRTDGRTDRRTEVKQYTPSPFGERGYNYTITYSEIW
jgi:hypothetical protein